MLTRFLRASLFCALLFPVTLFSQSLHFDSTFTPAVNGQIEILEIQPDGKILIVGDFTVVNGVARKEMARLNADGTLDATFDASWLGGQFNQNLEVTSMALLPDGKILVSGALPYDGSTGRVRVRRLNSDGSPDAAMTSVPVLMDSGFATVNKVNQLPDGRFFLCGDFELPNGNAKTNIARYNANGTFDATFTTTIDHECIDIEVQPDGRYLMSGFFANVNGSPSESLVRFNTDGSIDPSFSAYPAGSDSRYTEIKLLSDGRMHAFRQTSGFHRVSRLNADGSLSLAFPTTLDDPGDVAVQPNGKTIVVGVFFGGAGSGGGINRFNRDGFHDPSIPRFDFRGPSSPNQPQATAFDTDGRLIIAGNFTDFDDNTNPDVFQANIARLTLQAIPTKRKFDFDADGKDDMAVFRPGNSVWYLNRSTDGFYATQFGISTDKPIAYDHDGDGKTDIAVFRDGVWYWLRSSDNVFAYRVCGQAGDIPQPGNYNGFCLVYRPSPATFFTQAPFGSGGPVEFRDMTLLSTDKPVVADYDGDGRDDLAVFRDGNWFYMTSSSNQTRHYHFGAAGDVPVIGDFDGDLRSDFAVFRPSDGTWYINRSHEGVYIVRWGLAGDLPVPGDYDGDGKTDIAVYRDGVWYQLRSNGTFHIEQFGLSGDIPAQLLR